MCTVLLPPGGYPIAVRYIISYHIISYHIISYHIISYHIISYHIIFGLKTVHFHGKQKMVARVDCGVYNNFHCITPLKLHKTEKVL